MPLVKLGHRALFVIGRPLFRFFQKRIEPFARFLPSLEGAIFFLFLDAGLVPNHLAHSAKDGGDVPPLAELEVPLHFIKRRAVQGAPLLAPLFLDAAFIRLGQFRQCRQSWHFRISAAGREGLAYGLKRFFKLALLLGSLLFGDGTLLRSAVQPGDPLGEFALLSERLAKAPGEGLEAFGPSFLQPLHHIAMHIDGAAQDGLLLLDDGAQFGLAPFHRLPTPLRRHLVALKTAHGVSDLLNLVHQPPERVERPPEIALSHLLANAVKGAPHALHGHIPHAALIHELAGHAAGEAR